jgi:hypothetical protein
MPSDIALVPENDHTVMVPLGVLYSLTLLFHPAIDSARIRGNTAASVSIVELGLSTVAQFVEFSSVLSDDQLKMLEHVTDALLEEKMRLENQEEDKADVELRPSKE